MQILLIIGAMVLVATALHVVFEGANNLFGATDIILHDSYFSDRMPVLLDDYIYLVAVNDIFIIYEEDRENATVAISVENSDNDFNQSDYVILELATRELVSLHDIVIDLYNLSMVVGEIDLPLQDRDDTKTVKGVHVRDQILTYSSIGQNVIVGSVGAIGPTASLLYSYIKKGFIGCQTCETKDGDVFFSILTCTTGKHCDTTASQDAIDYALQWAISNHYHKQTTRGSISLHHGGTWHSCIQFYNDQWPQKGYVGCPNEWCG